MTVSHLPSLFWDVNVATFDPAAQLFPLRSFGAVAVADGRDIAGMKIEAIGNRGSRRDFVDLYVAAHEHGLAYVFECFARKYAAVSYSRTHLLKALVYFRDAEEEPLPDLLVPMEWSEVTRYFRAETPHPWPAWCQTNRAPPISTGNRPHDWLASGFGRSWMWLIEPIFVSLNLGMYELQVAQKPAALPSRPRIVDASVEATRVELIDPQEIREPGAARFLARALELHSRQILAASRGLVSSAA